MSQLQPNESLLFSKADILHAIANGEMTPHYQPQMSADGVRVCGIEALARWNHPQHGLIMPGHFLPQLSGDAQAMQALCDAILRQGCRDGRNWPGVRIAVNIDPQQFHIDGFVERIETITAEEGFPLNQLELEITEASYFDNPARMHRLLSRLRRRGVSIALDDFGTGYSSLSCLIELPLDKLKIDAHFVRNIDQLRGASVIHAVVALARAIGLKVTAEGVETHRQKDFLRISGCHYLQGYFFSRPVGAAEMASKLHVNDLRPAMPDQAA